jgi:predicted permease
MTPGSPKHYPVALRKVRYFDADHQRFLVFLTNNFELPALIIANLYKARRRSNHSQATSQGLLAALSADIGSALVAFQPLLQEA